MTLLKSVRKLFFQPIEVHVVTPNTKRIKGGLGELLFQAEMMLMNRSVEKTGVGSDFKIQKQTLFGRKVGKPKYAEVKFGKSSLTKRQRKEQTKRGSKYLVKRYL